jgi:glutathione S-transferase
MRVMRVLYHFEMSVFSRRTRLALAHKGLDVELRDGRVDPANLTAAREICPLRTLPVLVDEGRVVGDSGTIAHYLDLAYPDRPSLWPRSPQSAQEALAVTTAIDIAMNAIVDMGTRYWDLRGDPAWEGVLGERMSRAQLAIESVAAKAKGPILAGDSWGAAEIWTFSAVFWVTSLPGRVKTAPHVAPLLALGFEMPEALIGWAAQHAERPDVRAIYG